MNIDVNEMLQIVGTKEVENALLRKKIFGLEQELSNIHKRLKELEEQVTANKTKEE